MTVQAFARAIGGGIAVAAALALTACGTPSAPSDQAAPAPVTTPAQAPEPQAPAAQETPEPAATPDPALTPSKTPDPKKTEKKPDPAGAAILKAGSTGTQVKDLQARLKQLRWFPGEISGNYGATTTAAVKGFQGKRGLADTGDVDAKTLDALKSLTRTPTAADLADKPASGPALLKQGSTGEQVKDLQARLKQVGWFSGQVTGNYGSSTTSAVANFQAKRGLHSTGAVDQLTLTKLQSMTRKPTADELADRPAAKPADPARPGGDGKAQGLDPRCMSGRVLCISKVSNKLWWLNDGKVIDSVSVRFGSQELPTREGVFSVNSKSKDHVSTLYHTKMPYAMFFSGGQAIHYSPDFAARGYNGASHGCVNVRDLGAIQTMFSQVSVGTKVVVYS